MASWLSELVIDVACMIKITVAVVFYWVRSPLRGSFDAVRSKWREAVVSLLRTRRAQHRALLDGENEVLSSVRDVAAAATHLESGPLELEPLVRYCGAVAGSVGCIFWYLFRLDRYRETQFIFDALLRGTNRRRDEF